MRLLRASVLGQNATNNGRSHPEERVKRRLPWARTRVSKDLQYLSGIRNSLLILVQSLQTLFEGGADRRLRP